MSAQDGGAAFPTLARWKDDTMNYVNTGMTLRDYFAAKAGHPPGSFMRNGCEFDEGGTAKYFARWAYAYADAMLAEREKEQPK